MRGWELFVARLGQTRDLKKWEMETFVADVLTDILYET
jgi:hypothetical protein